MQRDEYVKRRRSIYMAQVLEEVEEAFVALLPAGCDSEIAKYRQERAAVDGNGRPDSNRRHGAFERHITPFLPDGAAASLQALKGQIRAKFNALAKDCLDLMHLGDSGQINGAALDLRHQTGYTSAGAATR